MTASPSLEDVLEDDSLAPLKRNHACFQCKKRKVKCDGAHPACGPCRRSHAHAVRTAQRNKTSPPAILCSWADGDSPDGSDSGNAQPLHSAPHRSNGGEARKRSGGEIKKSRGAVASKGLEREKATRADEEKETLLARIAQLEAQLAGLTPSDGGGSSQQLPPYQQSSSASGSTPGLQSTIEPMFLDELSTFPPSNTKQAWVQDTPELLLNSAPPLIAPTNNINLGNDVFNIDGLFMVPANWPPGLPSPFLLEHLIDVFFTNVPQLPRMIHRGRLFANLRLPPTHADFPHPSLLHAICACAAPYTAWVNNIPPEHTDDLIAKRVAMYGSLEGVEDFGLSQSELSYKSMRRASTSCMLASPVVILQVVQSSIILADLYFNKNLALMGWMTAGIAPKLIKALEIMNKNQVPRVKKSIGGESRDSVEREERLATVWMAYIIDSGFTLNSSWSGSFEHDEVHCSFPTSFDEFKSTRQEMTPNHQNAHTPNMLADHPVPDAFVLACKAATLNSRVSKWVRDWYQRDIVPGDKNTGMNQPGFIQLVNDINMFQSSIPGAMRSIFKLMDCTTSGGIDGNLMMVHILPNVALCLLYEPFIDWDAVTSYPLQQVQKAYEAVLGVLHMLPSNLDITLVTNSVITFSIYTAGRFVAHFVQRANKMQQFGLSVRCRNDLRTVQNILTRYGQKHTLGPMMSGVLDHYVVTLSAPSPHSCPLPESSSSACVSPNDSNHLSSSTSSSIPTPPDKNNFVFSTGPGSSGAPTPDQYSQGGGVELHNLSVNLDYASSGGASGAAIPGPIGGGQSVLSSLSGLSSDPLVDFAMSGYKSQGPSPVNIRTTSALSTDPTLLNRYARDASGIIWAGP